MEPVLRFILWSVYLVSLYFVIFWFLVFLDSKKEEKKKAVKIFPFVTIVVPCLNEEKHLRGTMESALELDYPKDKYEILIINNGSTDNTVGVAKQIIADFPDYNIELISLDKKGKGLAMNEGLRRAKGEYFICFDVDSYIDKDGLKKLLAHFDDNDNIAAVLPCMKVHKPKNLLEKVQYCEYVINMYYKWLMGLLDCVHVAPGPFSVYRTNVLRKIGGFDEHTITEDLEITYRLQKYHYKIKQVLDVNAYTLVPRKMKPWYSQRNRWFKGTFQNTWKYRELMFNKKYGDFGMIQLPTVFISGILAIVMLLLTVFYSSKAHISYLLDLRHVGFDVWTFLTHLGFNFNILDINYAAVITAIFMLILSIIIIRKAYVATQDNLFEHGYVPVIFFMFIYFLFLGVVWLGVSIDLLRGKVQRW